MMESTTFDEILGLEEQFYQDGYDQGLKDGFIAGRIEGRVFGLEKGFEKFVESGRLHGKSIIWANRVPGLKLRSIPRINPQAVDETSAGEPSIKRLAIPEISNNVRLIKNIKVLYALAESESLSTENNEEAVSEFDDRLKRAQAKAKIIEKMVGETREDSEQQGKKSDGRDGSIEDVDSASARH